MRKTHRYILLSNDSGERLELEQAPIGFDSTKFNLIRDLVYIGILKKISVEFEFVGDGFDFMQRHRLKYGVDSDILLRRYRNNPNEFEFEGKVNQENYNEDRKFNKYKVDIIQSSFVQKFQNREDVKLNVLNSISMDRLPVAPAALKNATIRGKQIEFYSEFEGTTQTTPDIYSHILPFLIKKSGNEGVSDNFYTFSTADSAEDLHNELYNPDTALYTNNLPTTQSLHLTFDINFSVTYLGEAIQIFLGNAGPLTIRGGYKLVYKLVVIDENGVIQNTLFSSEYENLSGNFSESLDQTFDVAPGHSVVFANERHIIYYSYEDGDFQEANELDYMPTSDDFGNGIEDYLNVRLRTEIVYNSMSLIITTSSVVPDSVHPVLLPHELFSNLIAQINGGQFYSEVFGREDLGYDEDGEFAYLGITTGELLRGIAPDEVQIPTSMREAFSSYSSVICLGAIITDRKIRIDPLDVLFNSNIAASIGEVSELHIVPAKGFLFNSVKNGYPIFDYEQENGRDEVNTEYQFTNALQAVKKELNLVSKYYAGAYFAEFARRLSIINTGTSDTKYDGKICFIDLIKQEDGSLISRRLEGILFVEGIFSPETAINLRIAPGQNMLRWKKYLNIPLDKKDKVYYFQSKDKNASLNLVTTLGETIDGKDLNTGSAFLFKPEERQFKCPITIDLLFAILANPLGIVHYTYEGEKFFDYLFEVDAETDKGQAVWRTLGTKDSPVQVVEDVDDGDVLMWGDGLEDAFDYGSGEILYQ
jgi:hypothetical protein